MRRNSRGYVLSGLLLFVVSTAHAQAVRGRVVEAQSRAPIVDAAVRLLTTDGKTVVETLSADSGWFELTAPRSGHYRIQVERIGYPTVLTNPLRLVSNSAAEVELRLSARAVQLPAVDVKVEARKESLELVGYYTRKREGLGTFLDEADIEARKPVRTMELFYGVAGVRVFQTRKGEDVLLRAGVGGAYRNPYCEPGVFIDGLLVRPFDFRDIRPSAIEGIEIYSNVAVIPTQYSGTDAGCGVILVWTRK